MNRKVATLVAFFLVFILPVCFLIYFMNKERPSLDELPYYGRKEIVQYISGDKVISDTVTHQIPPFTFVAHTGDTITERFVRDRVFVADYIFTHCPTICIDMTSNLKKVQEEFLDTEEFFILSYTVDPDRDSVARMYEYAQDYEINSKRWLLLTGGKKELYDLARNGYMITATEGDGGPDDFIHSEKLVLIDKDRRIRGYYDGTSPEEVDVLIEDIKKLLVSYITPKKKND